MMPDLREAARFVFAGALNTAGTYVLYLALLPSVGHVAAYTLAYVVGIVASYFLSTGYVFRARRSRRNTLLFPLVYVVQYLAGVAILRLCVEGLGIPAWLGALVCIVCTIPITYFLSRAIITQGTSTR